MKYKNQKGRVVEHWNAYGNKKDNSRYIEKPCVTSKFKGHTHKVRKKEKHRS